MIFVKELISWELFSRELIFQMGVKHFVLGFNFMGVNNSCAKHMTPTQLTPNLFNSHVSLLPL